MRSSKCCGHSVEERRALWKDEAKLLKAKVFGPGIDSPSLSPGRAACRSWRPRCDEMSCDWGLQMGINFHESKICSLCCWLGERHLSKRAIHSCAIAFPKLMGNRLVCPEKSNLQTAEKRGVFFFILATPPLIPFSNELRASSKLAAWNVALIPLARLPLVNPNMTGARAWQPGEAMVQWKMYKICHQNTEAALSSAAFSCVSLGSSQPFSACLNVLTYKRE